MTFHVKISDLLSDGNVRFTADAGLVDTIKEHGVLVPLEVYRTSEGGTTYYIKDGHRRLTGAILAGMSEVPCVEVPAPTDRPEQIVHQFVINEHRRGLTQLEKAEFYRRLREDFGLPQKLVAEQAGVSEAEVSLALAALRAHPAIRDAMLEGKLSHSAVEPVLSLPYEDQEKIAPLVLKEKTVRKVAEAVKVYRAANGLERTIRTPKVTEQKAARAVDPLAAMAVDGLDASVQNLNMALGVIVTDEVLRQRGLNTVYKILDLAEKLRLHLEVQVEAGGEVEEAINWDEELANF